MDDDPEDPGQAVRHPTAPLRLDAAPPGEVTRMLQSWSAGDDAAFARLLPLVYDELRRMAQRHLHREREGHTLQGTSLVHEVWLRLAAKRGGGAEVLSLDLLQEEGEVADPAAAGVDSAPDLLAIDQALRRLERLDPQQGRVVELRYFSGLSISETADVLGVSPATVKREWTTARAWLLRELDRLEVRA